MQIILICMSRTLASARPHLRQHRFVYSCDDGKTRILWALTNYVIANPQTWGIA
jgi:hypothetical protein